MHLIPPGPSMYSLLKTNVYCLANFDGPVGIICSFSKINELIEKLFYILYMYLIVPVSKRNCFLHKYSNVNVSKGGEYHLNLEFGSFSYKEVVFKKNDN